MTGHVVEQREQPTGRFDNDALQDEALTEPEVTYRPVPDDIAYGEVEDLPVWRVRIDLTSDPARRFGLDINGEIILGRSSDVPNLVDLSAYDAAELGVSRQHLMLRPTPPNLFAIDLGSTNGTLRNDRPIGRHAPSRLLNGDTLTLGTLQFVVRIVERPSLQTALLKRKSSLADAMTQIAKAVTSQLDVDEVLNQVAETAMLLTTADETGVWLVDEDTGELFLEAERGIEDEKIRRMRLPISEDTLMGQAITTGKPQRAHRQPGEDPLKVKTHYLVEALIYMPITLGGVVLGMLAAVHRQVGKQFKKRDEQLLEAIADFAAIAIQNARLYQTTDRALQRRVQELSAINQITHAVSRSLDLDEVYDVLVKQIDKHWPAEAVHLYLLDERENTLFRHQTRTDADDIRLFPVGRGILGKVAQGGEAFVSNEVQAHSDFDANIDAFDGQDLYSMACVPLCVQNQVVGVLSLFNKVEGSFASEDMDLLKAFANPVGTAIENARLFAESERRLATISATARTFSQPLLILDAYGDVLVANRAAKRILETNMPQLFAGISSGVGHTTEVAIGDRIYLSTVDHLPEVGTIVIMQDITYVQQLELDRSEFVHVLSHNLRTPFALILGWADMLRGDLTPEKKDEFIDNLTASAGRMLNQVDQMLHIVTEADAVQLVKQPCDLGQILSTVVKDLKGMVVYKSITLSFEKSGHVYPIWADETHLYHLVRNLVDNAIKYSPNKTTITVQLDFSELVITIRVQDEGPGIPKEEMPYIFGKFYRGVQAKNHPGTGLGLSVVRAIAEAHGGSVDVRNISEGGAAFTVKLPGSLRLPVAN
jgi:signal transduction histidine kinase/pSer/pThr/pTyr-binding forkhead associated (FHA) protein